VETGKQKSSAFHLSGIIPIAGQELDFNFPWHDCLQPVSKGYTALNHAVMECAWAGCETIWIVCHKETQSLVRHQVGEYVQDPVWYGRTLDPLPSEVRKIIPIYYVPIHPKDRYKRDCLGWSVLYGANVAYWTSKQMSKWVIPDKYYVSFPYGVYDSKCLRKHRKDISSKRRFYLSQNGKTVRDGEYLGFTFDGDDFIKVRGHLRRQATGIRPPGNKDLKQRLPIEERWSARHFSLDKIFNCVILEEQDKVVELSWYHDIGSWDRYCDFMASPNRSLLSRPYKKIIDYKEFNPIGKDNE
jgi:hypothetical protein